MKNEVLNCIYTRRSVRDYMDKEVSKEIIDELLNAAVMAPSAMNSQPWQFTIVEGKEKIKHFGEIAIKQWNLLGLAIKYGLKLKGAESIFYNAPLLIIISGKKDYDWLKDDVNLAVQNMFLAGHSLGLGSCWIGFGKPLNADSEAKKELGIPENCEIVAPLIFGYPKKVNDKIPVRKPKILKWI
ncbi:MAG: nitroreductase [archaeon]